MFPFFTSLFLSLLIHATVFLYLYFVAFSCRARYHAAAIIERPRKVAGFEYQMRSKAHARPAHARVHCDEYKFSMNDGGLIKGTHIENKFHASILFRLALGRE